MNLNDMNLLTKCVLCAAILCLALGSAGAGADAARGGEAGRAVGSSTQGGLETPLYLASGVRDRAGVATVLHCTNTGVANALLTVDFYEFNGAIDCTISGLTLGPNTTRTVGTRDTLLYFEDQICPQPPLTEQGAVRVSADFSGSLDVICTVQLIDAATAIPAFLTPLELFDGNGRLVGEGVIFDDGFEL